MKWIEKVMAQEWLEEGGDTLYVDADLPSGDGDVSLWVKKYQFGWQWFAAIDFDDGTHTSAQGDDKALDVAKQKSFKALSALLGICGRAHEVD